MVWWTDLKVLKAFRKNGFFEDTLYSFGLCITNDLCLLFAIESTQLLSPIDGLFIMVIGGLGMVALMQGGSGAYHLVCKIDDDFGHFYDAALLFATIVHLSNFNDTFRYFSFNAIFKRKAKSGSVNNISNNFFL